MSTQMSTHAQAPAPPSGQLEGTEPGGGQVSNGEGKVRRILEFGGLIAAALLIAFGAGALIMSVVGRNTIHSELLQQKIVGAADMNAKATAIEAKQAGLPASVVLPTCSVAGKTVADGATARCFASYMRIHALEATGNQTYSQVPQYATSDGKGTNDPSKALNNAQGEPQENPARTLWITETALSTALNTSYMAEQLGFFGIVVGVALLLSGIGFGILALSGALRMPETALTKFLKRRSISEPSKGH